MSDVINSVFGLWRGMRTRGDRGGVRPRVEPMERRVMLSAMPGGPVNEGNLPGAMAVRAELKAAGAKASASGIKLSAKASAPGQVITIKGQFNPGLTTEVAFTEAGGVVAVVNPVSVKASAIQVAAPIYLDPVASVPAAGNVTVQVRQHTAGGVTTFDAPTPLGIYDLPQTGIPASGALTKAYVDGMVGVTQKAIDTFTKIANASAGSVDASALLSKLQTLHDHYSGLSQLIAPVVSDSSKSVVIGQHSGKNVVLTAGALATCDRVIAGAILGGKGAAPALAPAFAMKAAGDDPFGFLQDMASQVQTLVTDTIPKQIVAFAEKQQAAGNLVVGTVAVAAILVGTPEALAAGAALGAAWFLASTFAPAGVALSLEGAGNEIANGHVSWGNVQPAITYALKSAGGRLVSVAADAGAEAYGTFAQLTVAAAGAVNDLGTLLAPENPSSPMTAIRNSAKAIYDNLHPKHPFSLNPVSLHFSAVEGGASPGTQTVTVLSLSGAFSSYHYTSQFGWMGVSSPSFSTLVVSADPTGLSPGTYTHPITVTDDTTHYKSTVLVTLTVTAAPTPVLSSTWHGTLTYPVFGFGDDTANMTWNLTQSGKTVGGSYSYTIVDSPVDAPGTVYQGTFVSGSIVGNTITLTSAAGWTFTGTVSGNTINGSTNILQGNGTFSMQS
jgi:hypothetical protein